jgi:hypothetical protein
MKKFLLLGAAAMMACAANAQTLEKLWSHGMTNYGAAVRNIVLVNGNEVAATNISFSGGADNVIFFDANGQMAKTYDVKAYLNEAQIGTTGDDGAFTPYTLGRGIDVDAVGNIIVNLGFPNATQGKEFVVIASDGTMRHIHCEVPAPGESDRADFFACAGNINENGYFALAPNKKNYVGVYNIFEGEQDSDYSYLVDADEGSTYTNEAKVVFPNKTVTEDAEFAPEFFVYHRSVGGVRYSDGSSAMVNLGEPFAHGKNSSTGIGAFQIDGVNYIVMPDQAAGAARTPDMIVLNVATKETVATSVGNPSLGSAYTQDFSAFVNADGTVSIAQLVQGKSLTMYKLTLAASAIENVAADNAAVEYYNLQGVKVANPENGIFVKKQGAKATKVVL